MIERPTLEQLRSRVQKGRHREIGNWLARRVARPSAVYGTWAAVRLGASAHQVTCVAILAGLAGAAAIGCGTRYGFVIGVMMLHLAFWLDHVDGQVARWRGTSSLDGVYLDYLMHHVSNLALGFALGYGLAARSGDLRWASAGFAVAMGWAGLGLHNDCRYKAFFQRLKRETTTYRVDGGSGGRPAPAPSLPLGEGALATISWLILKACEPHVVLVGLTGLAALALVDPFAWHSLWRIGVLATAALAPALALARSARAVRRGKAEDEFAQWFQPLSEKNPPTDDAENRG